MRRILFYVLVLLLASCAAGSYFTVSDANRVRNGMTKEEVITVMGASPSTIIGRGEKLIWTWNDLYRWRTVTFAFDNTGRTYGIPDGGVFGDTQKYLEE